MRFEIIFTIIAATQCYPVNFRGLAIALGSLFPETSSYPRLSNKFTDFQQQTLNKHILSMKKNTNWYPDLSHTPQPSKEQHDKFLEWKESQPDYYHESFIPVGAWNQVSKEIVDFNNFDINNDNKEGDHINEKEEIDIFLTMQLLKIRTSLNEIEDIFLMKANKINEKTRIEHSKSLRNNFNEIKDSILKISSQYGAYLETEKAKKFTSQIEDSIDLFENGTCQGVCDFSSAVESISRLRNIVGWLLHLSGRNQNELME